MEMKLCFWVCNVNEGLGDTIPEENNKGKGICSLEVGLKGDKSKGDSSGGISLVPFGLATYKMNGKLWINPETLDQERILSLLNAADSWYRSCECSHASRMEADSVLCVLEGLSQVSNTCLYAGGGFVLIMDGG
ncbi:hypothetical protein HHK36_014487 [Tetracentron sinense]|uniref:Uncharacterized protein n=1 Tax=Tetracentron sinense TaxID=13715 RepID=A0A834Z8H8_TETSI|nr:hypothetical protein HHK36_014487 [Tetracentron sinense]